MPAPKTRARTIKSNKEKPMATLGWRKKEPDVTGERGLVEVEEALSEE